MGRIIGIDYGLKRTGLAVSDPLKIIATALDTIQSDKVLDYLKSYCQKEEVESFVLGMPKNLNGADTDGTAIAQVFNEQLKEAFPDKKIYLVDERFTSKIAFNSMLSNGTKKKDRREKGNIDKIAATIILQDFMQTMP